MAACLPWSWNTNISPDVVDVAAVVLVGTKLGRSYAWLVCGICSMAEIHRWQTSPTGSTVGNQTERQWWSMAWTADKWAELGWIELLKAEPARSHQLSPPAGKRLKWQDHKVQNVQIRFFRCCCRCCWCCCFCSRSMERAMEYERERERDEGVREGAGACFVVQWKCARDGGHGSSPAGWLADWRCVRGVGGGGGAGEIPAITTVAYTCPYTEGCEVHRLLYPPSHVS